MMNILETKYDDVETKAAMGQLDFKKISEDGEFEGFGAVFNNIDRGRDKILPGAFLKSLKSIPQNEVKLLRGHNPNHVIGEWIEIEERGKGLYAKGKIYNETELGKETLFLMRKGQLTGLSVGYQTVRQNFMSGDGKKVPNHRELLELMLFEISVVTFAMNPKASVDRVKSEMTQRDVERVLREGGASSQFAKMVAIHGFDGASERLKSHREGGLDASIVEKVKLLSNTIRGK